MGKESRIKEIGGVLTPEAELLTPIRDVVTAFTFPAFGPGNYDSVVKQVLDAKQKLPTGEQTAFMLDDVYNSGDIKDSLQAESVKGMMNNGCLWVQQVEVWTPRNIKNPGMYSVFDEKGEGLSRVYTNEELEDRLSRGNTERGVRFSQNRSVAFAPLNTIRAGKHEKGTLSHDGAYIATFDVKGAEKLDAVAKDFMAKPYSYIVNNDTDSNIQRVSALDRSRYLDGVRVFAYFDSGGRDRGGYVVSVSGSRPIADNKS